MKKVNHGKGNQVFAFRYPYKGTQSHLAMFVRWQIHSCSSNMENRTTVFPKAHSIVQK